MVDKTVVALFPDIASAESVLADMETAGIRDAFTIMGNATAKTEAGLLGDNTAGRGFATNPGVVYDTPERRVSTLTNLGIPQDDAECLAESVRRGAVVVVGRFEQDMHAARAQDLLDRHMPADIEARRRAYHEAGWVRYDATALDHDAARAAEESARHESPLGDAARAMRDANERPGLRRARVYPARS